MMTLNRVIDQAIFGVSLAAGTRATISVVVSSKLHQNNNLKLLISRESRTTDKTDASKKAFEVEKSILSILYRCPGILWCAGGFPF